jgi:hypothetical protein
MVTILAYTPFASPLPIYNYWWALLFPLLIGIAIAYKGVKCATMKNVPREATQITVLILLGMVAVGIVLTTLVKMLER